MTKSVCLNGRAPTVEQLAAFARDGYLVLPECLAADELSALRTVAGQLASRYAAMPGRAFSRPKSWLRWLRGGEPYAVSLGRYGSVEFQNVLNLEAVRVLIDRLDVLALVTRLLSFNIYVYLASIVISPPGPADMDAAPIGWHQDSSRVNADTEGDPRPRLSVKAAYFLTDTRLDHGANMWIIPGSHLWNDLPSDAEIKEKAQPIQLPAGSIVVFDRRLWHSATANHSNRTREVVFIGYAYRWLRRHDDMDIRALRRETPLRRQLLGAGTDATSYYSPDDVDVPLRSLCASATEPSADCE